MDAKEGGGGGGGKWKTESSNETPLSSSTGVSITTTAVAMTTRPADPTSLTSAAPAGEKKSVTPSTLPIDSSLQRNRPNQETSSTNTTTTTTTKKNVLEDIKVKIAKPKNASASHDSNHSKGQLGMNDLVASVKTSSKNSSEKGEKKKKEKNKKQLSRKLKKEGSVSVKKSEGGSQEGGGGGYEDGGDAASTSKKAASKKGKKKKEEVPAKKKKIVEKLSPAQTAVKDMMRQLLEEDKYSVQGSIVDTDSSGEEEDEYAIYAVSGGAGSSKRGMYTEEDATLIHLDRSVIVRAARKRLRIEGMKGVMDTTGNRKRVNSIVIMEDKESGGSLGSDGLMTDDSSARRGRKKKKKKGKQNLQDFDDIQSFVSGGNKEDLQTADTTAVTGFHNGEDEQGDIIMGADESSIFGQTTGSSNATWVECDKCKKWRRLRGIVDAKKLPPKWYCTMNKNDPDRARCSAPEEEYETPITPETISDQRARKHLRLWVRRLQCNENYEARLPTMTRGKRRNATNPKDPYEWVRCCNPSCGKWRAVLRSMDASSVIDAARNGEWYCVLNTWDEKTASCAAPQENLPAIGCPPWVMQNED